MDKTAAITNYATSVGIRVTLPKWGLSRGEYFFDREKRIIAKGLTSIKYMSANLADELYDLARNKYSYFMDLLRDLDEKTSINSRQLDILIKLDFFSDFGNQRELLRITSLFSEMFKKGQAKQIRKSDVDGTPLEEIVKRYAVGVTKSGGIAKSYTLLDVASILREAETVIKAAGMDDLSDLIKVRNFYDVMGYIGYVSGNEATGANSTSRISSRCIVSVTISSSGIACSRNLSAAARRAGSLSSTESLIRSLSKRATSFTAKAMREMASITR